MVNPRCSFILFFLVCARPGVTAGKAAGMQVVAVPSLPKQSHLFTSADEVINSLLDFRPEKWGLPAFEDCELFFPYFNCFVTFSINYTLIELCYRVRRYFTNRTMVHWWSCHQGLWSWFQSARDTYRYFDFLNFHKW